MADFLGLMKQAAELKSKMEAMQAELDQIEVEVTSGGGLVTVRLSGKGEMRSVKIDESLIKPQEKEIVEDLIVAAHADARRKAEALLQEKMKTVGGGRRILGVSHPDLPLPGAGRRRRQGSLHRLSRNRDDGNGSRHRGQAYLVQLASVDPGSARAAAI